MLDFRKTSSNAQIDNINNVASIQIEGLKKQLKAQSSNEEMATKIANNKANRKIEFWLKLDVLRHFVPITILLLSIAIVTLYLLRIPPIFTWLNLLVDFLKKNGISLPGNIIIGIIPLLVNIIPTAVFAPIKYLASDERRVRLVRLYTKEILLDMK